MSNIELYAIYFYMDPRIIYIFYIYIIIFKEPFFQDANGLKKVIKSKKIELESGSGRKMSARIRSRRSMHDGKKLSAEIAALEVCRHYD